MYLECIDAGMRVFALWSIDGDRCGCGDPECAAAGKHPRASNWQHTPEWSEDQLEVMEEMGQFDTGYGILVRGFLVVDVDERNGGAASYEKLADAVPELAGAGLVVRSGSGGASRHFYFRLPEQAALVQHLDAYPGIDFKSSGYVVGPGSLHKSGNTYDVLVGAPSEIADAPKALVNLLKKPEVHRATIGGDEVDVSDKELAEMVSYVDADCDHETWYRIGMCIHHTSGGSAFSVWDQWSAKGNKYPGREQLDKRWHSFGKAANPVTLGTLVHYAEQAGWKAPVEFTADVHFEEDATDPGGTISTDGVDLLRPPGFVGQLAAWINARNRHARESLAVAGAIATISSVAGMRYVDPLDGVTPNVFLFGVSGSATGKESILKSHQELLRAAGVSAAVHGGMKSEQEIYRNLTRHQAALYVLDELGEQLSKIQNARNKGTASYLEGIVGAVMSIYSKANSFALVTGDLKDEISKALQAEMAGINKRMDDDRATEGDKIRHENLSRQIQNMDQGIENPYLCMFGLTTPERFDAIMDFDMAVNGFLGRSLIFREREDNPRSKPRGKIKRGPVPDSMAAALQQMYAPGHSEVPDRVERIGDMVPIPTRPDAEDMLDTAERLFWEMAESAKDKTGLTAIPRRGYEQVAKLSMILAIPEGLRTVEHVRWAYTLVKRDLEEKMKLAHSNSAIDKSDALASQVMSAVTSDHGETAGRLRNKCRKYRKEDVDKCIDRLVEAGYMAKKEVSAGKGKTTNKYFAINA